MVNVVSIAMQLYSSPLYWKQPYHTSKLSGEEWVNELINGHYDRIWHELLNMKRIAKGKEGNVGD